MMALVDVAGPQSRETTSSVPRSEPRLAGFLRMVMTLSRVKAADAEGGCPVWLPARVRWLPSRSGPSAAGLLIPVVLLILMRLFLQARAS